MPTIDRARLAEDAEDEQSVLRSGLARVRENAGQLDIVFRSALASAQIEQALQRSDADPVALLRIAGQAAAAMFALSRTDGEVVELCLEDSTPLALAGRVDPSTLNAANWLAGCWCAMTVRDHLSLAVLTHVPLATLESSPTRVDRYLLLEAAALRGYWIRRGDTADQLLAALRATDPAGGSLIEPAYVLNISVPELELFWRLLQGEAEPFETALEKALKYHTAYWGQSARHRQPPAHLALGLAGLAAEAADLGLPVRAESALLPRAALRPQDPLLVLCPYCLSPIAVPTRICPVCREDTTRDARLEMSAHALRQLEREFCAGCAEPVPLHAVRCPFCRCRP